MNDAMIEFWWDGKASSTKRATI